MLVLLHVADGKEQNGSTHTAAYQQHDTGEVVDLEKCEGIVFGRQEKSCLYLYKLLTYMLI
mgnify:CR=1 FL=1